MKTSISKRSKVLIAVLSIAVLLALTTVVVLANSTLDYGEKFNGVYLSSAGDVKLVFCYDKATTDAAEIDAFVVKYSDGREDVVYDKADLKETANGYEVPAAFAPAELNVVASVYASKGGVVADACDSYSVVEYANKVLASDGLAEYHNVTKAILNYGAMAQVYFDKDTSTLANAGLYDLGTNPAYGIDTDSVTGAVANVMPGEAITVKGAQMFCQTKTTLRVYFTYEGENALTATVSGAGLDNATAAVLSDADGYYVDVTNISAKLYDDVFTFIVTDGADVCTVEVNVLGAIKSQAQTTWSPLQNVVASMYLFYANVDGTVAANCAHGCGEYTELDGELAYRVCSVCNARLGEGVENEFKSLSTNRFNLVNEGYMVDAEGGFVFQRFHADTQDGNNTPMTFVTTDDEPVALKKYFVIKWRISTEWSATYMNLNFDGKMKGDANAACSCEGGVRGNNDICRVTAAVESPNANNWRVWVIDLEWDGVAVNETTSQLSFGHTPFTQGSEVDIAYAALCDNWYEISEYVTEDTVMFIGNNPNWNYHTTMTSAAYDWSGDLANALKIAETVTVNGDGSKTYTYANLAGAINATKTVPSTVASFMSPGTTKPVKAANFTSDGLFEEDGVVYEKLRIINNAGSNGALIFADANNTLVGGKYFVLKIRLPGDFSSTYGGLKYTLEGGTEVTYGGGYNAFYSGAHPNGAWKVVLFDLGETVMSNNVTSLYFNWNTYSHGANVDIAYAAFCNTWADIDAIVDEATVLYAHNNGGASWAGGSSTITIADKVTEEEAAAAMLSEKVVNNDDGSKTYVVQNGLGVAQTTKTVPATVASFMSAGTTKPVASANIVSDGLFVEDGFAYDRLRVKSTNGSNGALILADANNTLVGGKYLIIKMRMSGTWNTTYGGLWFTAEGSDPVKWGGGYNTFYTATNNNSWRVIFFDLESQNISGKTITSLYFNWATLVNGMNIDIAYVAFCDTWADIDAIVDEATVVKAPYNNGASWAGSCSTVTIADKVAEEASIVTETVETNGDGDKIYTYTNGAGEVTGTVTVPANVNSYVSAGQIANGEGTITVDANGVAYQSLGSLAQNGLTAKLNANLPSAAGRYFVIKLKSSTGTSWYSMTINGNSKAYNYSGGIGGGWAVLVYDLEHAIYDGCVDKDTLITALTAGHKAADIDVAFMATCDTWAEIQSIVGSSTGCRYMADFTNPLGNIVGNDTDVWGPETNIASCVAAEAAGTLQ